MATDLVVNIASQFLGKKAFLDADKATKKLSGSVKSLGRVLGVTFSAAAILAYGKASVKAASEDIKAQNLLANSLKNLGLAYAAVDAEGFINKMQSQTGVLDDYLRPAFAKLAGVTGSVAKTETLMALAFDVSSGSTLDYASAVDVLSQAYVGNNKGLKQLDLGLTQAEIKAMSFDDVLALLNERFAGSGKAALDTYTGQMDLLKVSASNASEIIGTSLLGAIDSLGGSDGIANVGTDIENAAKSLANFIDSIVYLKEQIATIPGAGIVKGAFGAVGNVLGRFSPQRAAELLKQIKGPQPFSQPMTLANQDTGRANLAAKNKAEKDAAKRAKELLALQNKQLATSKAAAKLAAAAAKLSSAQAKFGLQAISIEAALKATFDAETILRLKALQAIEADNGELALEYLSKINDLTKLTDAQKLAGIKGISEANLLSLNTTLLAELTAIDKTKMSEADKDLARQAAFAKYNDALVKQGGLQDLNYYNEKVQIQLNSIAKLAALQEYGAAEVTLNTILNANVKAIETAQSKADTSRFDALVKYIAKLDDAKNAALALAAATAAATTATVDGINAIAAAGAAAAAAAKAAADKAAADAITAKVIPSIPNPDYGGFYGGTSKDDKDAKDAGVSNGSTTVIVNTGSVLGTEQTIIDAVQAALQTINKYGNSQTYAGAIAI